MNNINLVPLQYKRFFRRKWYVGGGIGGGLLAAMVLSFLIYLPINKINIAKKEQIDLNKQLASGALINVKNIIEEIAKVQREKLAIEQDLIELDRPSHVSRKTMDIIVANVPQGICINQITIDGQSNTTSIRGNAKSIANVAQYMAGLYNIDQFQAITYTTSKSSEENSKWELEYDINIQLKPFQENIVEETVESLEEHELDDGRGDDVL